MLARSVPARAVLASSRACILAATELVATVPNACGPSDAADATSRARPAGTREASVSASDSGDYASQLHPELSKYGDFLATVPCELARTVPARAAPASSCADALAATEPAATVPDVCGPRDVVDATSKSEGIAHASPALPAERRSWQQCEGPRALHRCDLNDAQWAESPQACGRLGSSHERARAHADTAAGETRPEHNCNDGEARQGLELIHNGGKDDGLPGIIVTPIPVHGEIER